MNSIRQKIIDEALSWKDTPFAHFQCCKHAGVDCAHLIIGVGKNIGLLPVDFTVPYYPANWHAFSVSNLLVDTLKAHNFLELPKKPLCLGNVMLFKIGINICHVGILVRHDVIIHAMNGRITRKVILRTVNDSWLDLHLTHQFEYPNLGDIL